MNECVELDLQEMLPDLLHRTLDAHTKARVEAHLAGCASCTEELGVLRTVAEAAVFAPSIDVDRIVRQIPPYAGVPAVVQTPARSRIVSWLVAASLLIVAAGGGSLLMVQQRTPAQRVAETSPAVVPVTVPQTPVALAPTPDVSTPRTGSLQPTHALAIAAGVDALSDGDLRQLMTDMDSFDALPAAEPEPVIPVDAGDNLNQGL
jgi:Putative zinc-finger